jgi:hypothetical protein
MPAILQRIVSDQFRIYGFKSDGSVWSCSAIEPLNWSPLPVFTGTGKIASIALARTTLNDNSLSLYATSSDGTLWRLKADNTWFKENTP